MEMFFLNFVLQDQKMKNLLFLLISLLVLGCKQNTNPKPDNSRAIEDSIAFTQNLEYPNIQVQLLPEPKAITSEWLAYITAEIEIENFKKYNVQEVAANSRPIAEIMLSLKETIPDSLKSNAVKARVGVLYTKAKVLEQLSNKRNVNPAEINKVARQIPVEWNNLKIQLNELFLKTLEQFEKEVDEFEVEQEELNPPELKRPTPRKEIDSF